MYKRRARGLAALLFAGVVACGGGDGKPASTPTGGESAGDTSGAGDSSDGGAGGTPSGRTVLSGRYALASTYDLTSAGLFSDFTDTTLQALSGLSTNPSATIIQLLQNANVPIVSTVLGELPDAVTSLFEGWINDYVVAALYQDVPATQQIATIVSQAAQLVTRFEVDSELDVPTPDADGHATATHSLTGVAFSIAGTRTVVQEPALLSSVTTANGVPVDVLHIEESAPDVETGLLQVGDHSFGVPIGGYVLGGIDALVQSQFGSSNLRAALGAIVDCSALAANVSGQCELDVCVGHESDVEALCEQGLDAVVSAVDDAVNQLDINVLHLSMGTANMWNTAGDGGTVEGDIVRIDDGTWTAAMDVGDGAHSVPATFTGTRLPDGPTSSAPATADGGSPTP